MSIENLIYDGLQHPLTAISYHVSQTLDQLYPEKALLETDDFQFNLQTFAADRQCQASARPSLYNQIVTNWAGPEEGWRRASRTPGSTSPGTGIGSRSS